MEDLKYTVRKMRREDAPQVMDIMNETGKPQCINSLHTWHAIDPEAISVAVTDEGEIIGTCSALVYRDDLAFLGMYGVRKKYRGRGIGSKMWAACMEHVGDRNLCLYAGEDNLEMYRSKCDLPIVETDWACVKHKTSGPVHPERLSSTPPEGVDVVPLEEVHLSLVHAYDYLVVGFDRRRAIELSTKEPDAKAYVALKGGECVGYGVICLSCEGGGCVGPLYADDKGTAEVLLKQLMLAKPEAEGFTMMTCSCNGTASELMERVGCPAVCRCAMLFRKAKVEIDKRRVFALFNMRFELC